MNKKKYTLNRLLLKFNEESAEKEYRKHITEKTLLFCRISWAMLIVIGLIFGILDKESFGSDGDMVFLVRIILITSAGIIFALTFTEAMKRHLYLSSSLFIMCLGLFATFLVAMSDPTVFTPYFTSFFFAFAGIFTTVGIGFRLSIISMAFNILVFESIIGLIMPVPMILFLPYTFFLTGIFLVYAYIGYMVELFSRETFSISKNLKNSLEEIKTLSGLLPICSQCKKVRDDRGYWNQVDEYFRDHGNVTFSHSLCPDCVSLLHPTLKLKTE